MKDYCVHYFSISMIEDKLTILCENLTLVVFYKDFYNVGCNE